MEQQPATLWDRVRNWFQQPHVRTPLTIGIMTRVIIFVVAFVGIRLMGEVKPNPFLYHGGTPYRVKFIDNFQRYDSYWFLNIARNRYQYHGVQDQIVNRKIHNKETNVTPFPLYPMLIWFFGLLTRDHTISGLLIALGTYLGSLVVFFRMVQRETDHRTATLAALYLSVYPTAWLYNAIYSESLFLLFTLLAMKFAQEERPVPSGLCGMGAAMTRLAGGVLAVPIFFEFLFGGGTKLRWNKLPAGIAAGALVSAGWALYFAYLWRLTGDFFIYFTAQKGWHKTFAPFWEALWKLIGPGLLREPVRMVELGCLVVFIFIFIKGINRLRVSHSIYVGLGLMMPLSVTNLLGFPRYLMVLFPAFVMLARWGKKNETIHQTILVGFTLLLGILMMTWVRWQYSF